MAIRLARCRVDCMAILLLAVCVCLGEPCLEMAGQARRDMKSALQDLGPGWALVECETSLLPVT